MFGTPYDLSIGPWSLQEPVAHKLVSCSSQHPARPKMLSLTLITPTHLDPTRPTTMERIRHD